jgi:hypothetical protein
MNEWVERREGVSRAGRTTTLAGDGKDARRLCRVTVCGCTNDASMMMMMMMRRVGVMGGAVTDDASRERARGR